MVEIHGQPAYESALRILISYWYTALISDEYSGRKLTYTSDKLPALSGLARTFHNDLQTDYFAGIWRCAFEFGLCWSRAGPPAPQSSSYQAPSFSWAALNVLVKWPQPIVMSMLDTPYFSHVKFVSCDIDLMSLDRFGAVSGGCLTLRGSIAEARATIVHKAICDVCNAQIVGTRFKCLDCQDFDLCHACRAQSAQPSHPHNHRLQQVVDGELLDFSSLQQSSDSSDVVKADPLSTYQSLLWQDVASQAKSRHAEAIFDVDNFRTLVGTALYALRVMSCGTISTTCCLILQKSSETEEAEFRRVGYIDVPDKNAERLFANIDDRTIRIK